MDLLRDDLVVVPLTARSRDDAFHELVRALEAGGDLSPARHGDVIDAILARERAHTTALGAGVAVPHGLTDVAPDVVGALGISREGLDFAAVDGAPVHIIFLMVVPRNRIQSHVRTLAGVARLLNDKPLRTKLLAAQTASEVMDVIVAKEEEAARS